MTKQSMIKKLNLRDEDFSKIQNAISSAEKNTSGEIQAAIIAESSSYSFWELLASLCIAVFLTSALLPLAPFFQNAHENVSWISYAWQLPAFYALVFLFVMIVVFKICNLPFFDRIIVPKRERKKKVSHRALRFFAEGGIYKTETHSGILIFISFMEKEVRIIADAGIAEKISNDLWRIIADELAFEIKQDGFVLALCNAIEKCGALLKENFSLANESENPNELSDSFFILENDR